MNRYEEKQEARRERLLARAEKNRSLSQASYNRARRIMDMIPLGQPILVGHHSEKHHRRDIARIDAGIGKSVNLGNYADHLEQRADSVGKAGISSDDPEAVVKLKEKLADMEESHARMKEVNKILKTNTGDIEDIRFTEDEKAHLRQSLKIWGSVYKVGYAPYELTNNGANIRRVKQRIEELGKKAATDEEKETAHLDGELTIRENPDINRIQLLFKGKPPEDTRTLLKRSGFRWSPYEGAWQRHLNESGRWAAKRVVEQLSEKAGSK